MWSVRDQNRHRRRQKDNYFKIRVVYPDGCTRTIETVRHLEPVEFFAYLQNQIDDLREGLEPGHHASSTEEQRGEQST